LLRAAIGAQTPHRFGQLFDKRGRALVLGLLADFLKYLSGVAHQSTLESRAAEIDTYEG
jgi:hypothetical protein